MTNYMGMQGMGLPYSPYPQQTLPYQTMQQPYQNMYAVPTRSRPNLPTELQGKHLSSLNVDQVSFLLISYQIESLKYSDTQSYANSF